jgi:hypothetical protein
MRYIPANTLLHLQFILQNKKAKNHQILRFCLYLDCYYSARNVKRLNVTTVSSLSVACR